MSNIQELVARVQRATDERDAYVTRFGPERDSLTDGQLQRYANLERARENAIAELGTERGRLEERAAKVEAGRSAALDPSSYVEHATGDLRTGEHRVTRTGNATRDSAARTIDQAFRSGDLPDYGAERATALLDRGDDVERSMAARWASAAGNPAYRTAFGKLLGDSDRGHLTWTDQEAAAYRDVHAVQRAMSLSTTAAMVPLSMDPAILITNAGSNNPLRQLARVEQITSTTWSGVSSAGATAEWKAEAAQAADGSPTLGNPTVPVWLGDVDVPYSYEAEQDSLNFLSELTKVILDAATNLQNAAYTTGSGTDRPAGLITGATTSPVSTAGAFAASHVFALQNALPARFQANATFLANLAVINTIAQFETTSGALKFPEIADGRLLRRPLAEVSDMTSDMTTASAKFAAYGDLKQAFLIADRVGATLEILPGYGANNRPTAQRHAFLTFRTGSKVIVPEAVRLLNKS